MRFIESILLKDGQYHHLELHQERINKTYGSYSSVKYAPNLLKILPKQDTDGTKKVRVIYNLENEVSDIDISISTYVPREIKSIELVEAKSFDYSYKFEDRTILNKLLSGSSADDIIICIDGRITDGSYFNLAFWDERKWFTPKTPLLNGVRRQQLLNTQKITEASLTKDDIPSFQKVSLINAMLDLGQLEVPTSAISTSRTDD
ncbi:MAG: aminotransferase class IV [Ekhidna sp.]|nr:aminotransferase class IV [Ekhidna sp.]